MPDFECWFCNDEYRDQDHAPFCSLYCRRQHRDKRGKGKLPRPKNYDHEPKKPKVSRIRSTNGILMGVCSRCNADLWVEGKTGLIFCSNGRCKHSRSPHTTSDRLNEGTEALA